MRAIVRPPLGRQRVRRASSASAVPRARRATHHRDEEMPLFGRNRTDSALLALEARKGFRRPCLRAGATGRLETPSHEVGWRRFTPLLISIVGNWIPIVQGRWRAVMDIIRGEGRG